MSKNLHEFVKTCVEHDVKDRPLINDLRKNAFMQNQSAGVLSNTPINMHLTHSISEFKIAETMNQLMLRFNTIDKENEARLEELKK